MQKIYAIIHIYDIDTGSIYKSQAEDILFMTTNKKVAAKFLKNYSNEHIYDIASATLYEGKLEIKEYSIINKYEDIPQEIIDWGIKNITKKDIEY